MDPFSLVIGIGSLVEMSLQLGKCLKDAYESAASFEEEIGSLLREMQDLNSVNKSIEHLHRTEIDNAASERLELPLQDREVWQNTARTLQECSETVKGLQKILDVIVGKNGVKVSGVRDRIKKQLRKQAKDGDLNQIRIKLSAHRESLNVSLTLLNLIHAQRGSKAAQKFGFQLHRQIAALQSSIPQTDTELFNESLHSATVVASTLRLNKHFDTPKAVSSIYTGRKGHLDGLKQAFDSSHGASEDRPPHKRFVVFGLGGSGKTQFCCKFASDNKQRFWGVFTVDASSPGNAQQSFIAIAKACGTNPNERAAKSWLSSSDRPWLLIIDNANDTNIEIESYFPDGEHGLTLITTRNPSLKMHGTIGPRYYHFERLENEEAAELLLRAAENYEPRTQKIMQLTLAITEKLGALPLALIHAGNAIKAKYCELHDYLTYYERSWQTIRQTRNLSGEGEDNEEYIKVYASYEIVYRGLEAIKLQRYRDAVQLLQLFSFLHYEHIPFDFLIATIRYPRIVLEADARDTNVAKQGTCFINLQYIGCWTKPLLAIIDSIAKKQFEIQNPVVLPTFLRDSELISSADASIVRLREALHLLTQLSLVTYYPNSDSYSMHPLVHTWVRQRPQMKAQIQAVWCEAALHTLSRSILLPPLNQKVDSHGELARKLLPHFISVRKLQGQVQQEFLRNQYNRQNRPWPALESRMNPWRSMFLVKCAIVYSECGYFAETEDCLKSVMGYYEKLLGRNHPRLENVALALSDTIWQQGRVNEQADLIEQVFNRNLESLGPDHSRTLKLLYKLGECRRQQGRFAESIEFLTKAVKRMRSYLPTTDPTTYEAVEQLGISLRTCFSLEDAKRHQEDALKGMKLYLGEQDTKTLKASGEIAITYMELSTANMESDKNLATQYLKSAHKHATFAYEQFIQQLGDKQPHTWVAEGTLWRVKAAMGEVDEAERRFSSQLPIYARHLGDDHLGIMIHKNHLAKLHIQQKRYHEAEALLTNISRPAKYKIVIGTGDNPDRWDCLWTLVLCYQQQGKISSGLEICTELIEAIRVIRRGRKQTQISSTFWQMALNKRVELMSQEDLTATSGSAAIASVPSSGSVLQSAAHSIGSDSHIAVPPQIGELRLRGTTW